MSLLLFWVDFYLANKRERGYDTGNNINTFFYGKAI